LDAAATIYGGTGGHGAKLARQLTHPLALLLWAAAGLSAFVGNYTIAIAIAVLLVILLNALFAFVQEL
jgi:magnesium-transporting ATPase (P-type)